MGKTANIIGATGLVGKQITQQLLSDDRYSTVRVFVRRSTGISTPKLDERIVDYFKIGEWLNEIKGDELYSALGTTIKKAGSQDRQYEIDFTYQFQAAEAAAKNGVSTYLLVSSAGANHQSRNFYTRMKGELDEAVKSLSFKNIHIFRPSILAGDRQENRMGERIGLLLAHPLTKLPGLRKYRPINGETVARAMIHAANEGNGNKKVGMYEFDEIFDLIKNT